MVEITQADREEAVAIYENVDFGDMGTPAYRVSWTKSGIMHQDDHELQLIGRIAQLVAKSRFDIEFEIDSHNATARNMLTVIEQRNSLRFKLDKYRDYANSLLGHLSNEPDTDEAKRAWDRLQALVDGDFPTEPEPSEPVEAKPDTAISVTTQATDAALLADYIINLHARFSRELYEAALRLRKND